MKRGRKENREGLNWALNFKISGWGSGPRSPQPGYAPVKARSFQRLTWDTNVTHSEYSQCLQIRVALQQTDTKANVFLRSTPFINTKGWLLVCKPGNSKTSLEYYTALPPNFVVVLSATLVLHCSYLIFTTNKIRQDSIPVGSIPPAWNHRCFSFNCHYQMSLWGRGRS